jgi:hypothetical protein
MLIFTVVRIILCSALPVHRDSLCHVDLYGNDDEGLGPVTSGAGEPVGELLDYPDDEPVASTQTATTAPASSTPQPSAAPPATTSAPPPVPAPVPTYHSAPAAQPIATYQDNQVTAPPPKAYGSVPAVSANQSAYSPTTNYGTDGSQIPVGERSVRPSEMKDEG